MDGVWPIHFFGFPDFFKLDKTPNAPKSSVSQVELTNPKPHNYFTVSSNQTCRDTEDVWKCLAEIYSFPFFFEMTVERF